MPPPFVPVPPRGQTLTPTPEQLEARKQDRQAREATRARTLDTRRKVLLGAALIQRARTDPAAWDLLPELVSSYPEKRDRAAFQGWAP